MPSAQVPARLGLMLVLLLVLMALLRIVGEREVLGVFGPEPPAPSLPAGGEGYRLLEVLPDPDTLPRSFTRRYGTCYHFTYEDPFGMGMGKEEIRRMILSSGARCGLLLISIETAADPGRMADLLAAAADGGLELVVIRVMVRPDWALVERAEGWLGLPWPSPGTEEGLFQITDRAYGRWVRVWAAGGGSGRSLFDLLFGIPGGPSPAQRLREMLVYLQVLNEPNVAEEYSYLPPDAPFRNGMYVGDFRALGRRVCAFHIPLIRALTPAVVTAEGGWRVVYHTNFLPLRLIISDLAAATGEQKAAYIAGCLELFSRAQNDIVGMMSAEYIRTGVRGVEIAYGMHIYLPCWDLAGAVDAIRSSQVEAVMAALASAAGAGLPLGGGVLVTEFGGSFSSGSGCDRASQRALYAIATASIPEIPTFWWVYASRQCGYGTYAGNTPGEWDKSALVRYDPSTRTFHACEAGP